MRSLSVEQDTLAGIPLLTKRTCYIAFRVYDISYFNAGLSGHSRRFYDSHSCGGYIFKYANVYLLPFYVIDH